MRLACLLVVVGCSALAPTPVNHHVAAEPPHRLEPVIEIPPADPACNLAWDEVSESDPPTLAMLPLGPELPDECPPNVDHGCANDTAADEDTACDRGEMRAHHKAQLMRVGPSGSGRFVTVGLKVGERFFCTMASTVGWRNLYPVGDMLAPLPWLADVDRDGDAELILWERLPWGDAEVENALLPVVYALDGDRLVRRDDKSHGLRAKVGAAYAKLATQPGSDTQSHACFVTLANTLH